MKDDISPEERLLRLIRNPKKKNNQDIVIEKEKKSPLPALDLKPVPRPTIHPLFQKYLSFVYIQKIISVGFIVAGIYFIFSFINPRIGFKKNDLPAVTEEKVMETETEFKKQEGRPFEFYLEGVKDKQIFGSLAQPETQKEQVPSTEASADLIKDMNLLGIISGEKPEAIIEDKKIGKTYYVTKGQSIGEFQVEAIQEGKVILNYHDQLYELYL